MKTLIALLLSLLSGLLLAQHQIGHYQYTFQDPDRGNRDIQTEVYYPATTAGESTPVAAGTYPVIVFGHGFVMAWDAYENLWSEFVPRGYIMVFPRTEGNAFSTDHQRFGFDLQFLVTEMQVENSRAGSPVFGAVGNNTALMGHSMGGGASFLAADSLCTNGNQNLKTLIGLAPAESTSNGVSSINSAKSVTIPSIILSGSEDAVTPPVDHHIPMFDSLASDCKTFIDVTGGAHCYFANSNFNCDFGEGSSGGNISISRTEQHEITFDFVNLWLDYTLKGDCESFSIFQDSLNASNRIDFEQDCNIQALVAVGNVVQNVACNGGNTGVANLTISGGQAPYTEDWGSADPNALTAGTYNVDVTDAAGCTVSQSITITEPTSIQVSSSSSDASCGQSDGSASLNISGGAGSYSENWNGANPNALSAGSHTVVVTDANNCQVNHTVTVGSVGGPTVAVNTTDVLCNGDATGTALANISGGSPGYTENWNGSNPNALTAGNYTLEVTDNNNCITAETFTISEPSALMISSTVQDEQTGNDGSITVSASGGTSGFEYSLDGTNYNNSNQFSNLSDGTYTVYVRDANGCVVSETVTIANAVTSGVNENELIWEVYPNPFENQLTIKGIPADGVIGIFEVSGRLVLLTQVQATSSVQILTGELTSGIYLMRYQSEDKQTSFTQKIIK